MKRWAVIVILLYAVSLIVFFYPLLYLCGLPVEADILGDHSLLWLFGLLIVFTAGQALMLFVPLKAVDDIQIKPRHLLVPVVTASMFMAILVAGLVASLLAAIVGDDQTSMIVAAGLLVITLSWVFWFVMFRSHVRQAASPNAFTSRLMTRLLQGSILELIVAVTSHIIVRRRGDCSSPIMTFFAIAAGVAVSFLLFGVGLFYLLAARSRRMARPRKA